MLPLQRNDMIFCPPQMIYHSGFKLVSHTYQCERAGKIVSFRMLSCICNSGPLPTNLLHVISAYALAYLLPLWTWVLTLQAGREKGC